jgi:hypothetical protein
MRRILYNKDISKESEKIAKKIIKAKEGKVAEQLIMRYRQLINLEDVIEVERKGAIQRRSEINAYPSQVTGNFSKLAGITEDFTFSPSIGAREEMERYLEITDYLADYFEKNPTRKRSKIYQKYSQKIISRLVGIYSQLRQEAGLTLKELAVNPGLETRLMQKCGRILQGITIKFTPDDE